ncbi:MAG: Co2+/Mg2+ efflux protein ApaG [Pseudomonadota bacterium]
MYEAITKDIRVRVEPHYDEQRSEPDSGRFFWLYTVDITNESDSSVTLATRFWQITDANGGREEVKGAGVVGQTPTLEPGQSFSYTSGCPLRTSSGIMGGSYRMLDQDGAPFDVEIPAFSLDLPFMQPTVN